MTLDGDGDDWQDNGSQVIAESHGPVQEVRAFHDEQSLWLRLVLDDENVLERGHDHRRSRPARRAATKGFPACRASIPRPMSRSSSGPGTQAELRQAAWWEPTRIRYGLGFGFSTSIRPTTSPAAASG